MKLSLVLDGIIKTDIDTEITDVCFDSRRVKKGSLFVAVTGYKTDGHLYIESAVKNGAAAVLAERETEGVDVPVLVVDNTRKALAQASRNFFSKPDSGLKMIGVTGTNGKTTTTTLIKQVLESHGHKCGLIGTNGNMIGDRELPTERTTPESRDFYELLAQMRDGGCEYVIMEVSSHSLELDRVYGIHFCVAVYTNLSRDHLDFHGDMDSYFEAKAKLFSRCDKAVINVDDAYGVKLAKLTSCDTVTYSVSDDTATLEAKNILLKPNKVRFEAVMTAAIARVNLGIPGLFSVYNALAAIGACMGCGLSLTESAAALASAHGVKGRAEVVWLPEDTGYTVLIDYAHSPDSMENILKTVRGYAQGRVISLFGAGGDRDKTKRPIMGGVGAAYSDICIITSDNPRSEEPMQIIADVAAGAMGKKAQVNVVCDRREAIAYALSIAKENDVIVLMGKGHETYQETAAGKIHLDEREEIAAYFSTK
ncbi:MAG: UDP-N-acetylmuramoyl-L-alanyl-D-glutamate--2,6-diaminopimelate ligase [Clostridia bacterium]|nr:UDP-N-acetylmuramoyl-L-alanyl-D-glutamate--2,6-diaminopimelate ligase [Clostridia bacterium]